MILRIEFSKYTPKNTLESFLDKPRGTCLDSSSAKNITPIPIKDINPYISFWFIDDNTLKKFYGGKVSINSLPTYPGIIKANEILEYNRITLRELNISENELIEMLEPFL
jgi:hypothetical protein